MHTAAERYRLAFSWVLGLALFIFIVFSRSAMEDSATYEVLELAGYPLLVLATLGRIWATVYIGGRKNSELCQGGPYSVTRNPLYLFTFCGAVGIILSAKKLILLAFVVPFFAYYYFVIISEEKRLLEHFGPPYAEYLQRVNRIWPGSRDIVPQTASPFTPACSFAPWSTPATSCGFSFCSRSSSFSESRHP